MCAMVGTILKDICKSVQRNPCVHYIETAMSLNDCNVGLGRVITMMCVNTTVQCPVKYVMQCCSLTDKSCCGAYDQSGEEFAVTLNAVQLSVLYSVQSTSVCLVHCPSVSPVHCTLHTCVHYKSVWPVH